MTKILNPMGIAAALLAAALFFGCGGAEPDHPDPYLARVGSREITVSDFNRAFEIGKAAYPHNEILNGESLRQARQRTINELIEEAMLLDQAESRQIRLSEAELETALADIRKDYPGDSFEELLMASAISFSDWKARLRIRLLIDKLIHEVLGRGITISEAEITAFLKKEAAPGPDADPGAAARHNEAMVRQLRQRKLEQAYQQWIEALRRQYAVEINKDQWETMTES